MTNPNPLFVVGEIVDIVIDGLLKKADCVIEAVDWQEQVTLIKCTTGNRVSYEGWVYLIEGKWALEPDLRKRPDANPIFSIEEIKKDMEYGITQVQGELLLQKEKN